MARHENLSSRPPRTEEQLRPRRALSINPDEAASNDQESTDASRRPMRTRLRHPRRSSRNG